VGIGSTELHQPYARSDSLTVKAVQIERLTGHSHLAPVLAAWHHAEWGHLYASEVWDLATAEREFAAMAEPGSIDQTLVAFEGASRDASAVLGSVSLVATDDLEGYEHLTPWLASMFVVPSARGIGVAGALIDALLLRASAAGHSVVHLFTSGQESFWADRGWQVLATVHAEGHLSTVMVRRVTGSVGHGVDPTTDRS
jgi:GNAT superfamily N-acetyltransferase